MKLHRLLPSVLAATTIGLLAGHAQAGYVIGGQAYELSSSVETINAPFNPAGGGTSVNSYSGTVQITVSGTGQSNANCFNDAFHAFGACGFPGDSNYYQLTIDDNPLVRLNPAQNAKNFIVYDLAAGTEVLSRPYAPAYNAGHSYSFAIDMGLLGAVGAKRLHFGVGDGSYGDNTGSYTIQIAQLTAQQAVPEPGTLMLLAASGLGFVVSQRRRKAQR